MREQIQNMERVAAEYANISGQPVGRDVMFGTLIRVLAAQARQHVQLSLTETSSYSSVRDYILSYELSSTSWSATRVQQALGMLPSTGSKADQGAQAKGSKGDNEKKKARRASSSHSSQAAIASSRDSSRSRLLATVVAELNSTTLSSRAFLWLNKKALHRLCMVSCSVALRSQTGTYLYRKFNTLPRGLCRCTSFVRLAFTGIPRSTVGFASTCGLNN